MKNNYKITFTGKDGWTKERVYKSKTANQIKSIIIRYYKDRFIRLHYRNCLNDWIPDYITKFYI